MDTDEKTRVNQRGDAWRQVNKWRLFLVGNMGLFVIVSVIWLWPGITSWRSSMDIVNFQQRIYDNYARQAAQAQEFDFVYDENIMFTHHVLPYEYLALAMADVHSLAQKYNMDITYFDASQPVGHDIDIEGARLVELRVSASLAGKGTTDFLYGLAESPAFVRRVRIDFYEGQPSLLRLEMSFFGAVTP